MIYSTGIAVSALTMQYLAHCYGSYFLYCVAFSIAMLTLNIMYVAYSGALSDLVPDGQMGLVS